MHNSVYGLASDEQLQQSLKLLNKDIAKAHKQSENEVVNGKRSTRKAVAAGALDRFLKDRVDLETYIKARNNGELQQRNNKIQDFNRNRKPNKMVSVQSNSDIGQTHIIPEKLLDKSHRLGDVLSDLTSMRTEGVKSDQDYAVKLLNRIAALNPNIQIVFTDNPKLASGLSEGGHYPFSKDGHEKVFIYPQGNWESDILSLVNHELVHAVTHKAIGLVPELANHFNTYLKDFNNIKISEISVIEDVYDRVDYATKQIDEFVAVLTAEPNVRKAIEHLWGDGYLTEFDATIQHLYDKRKELLNERKDNIRGLGSNPTNRSTKGDANWNSRMGQQKESVNAQETGVSTNLQQHGRENTSTTPSNHGTSQSSEDKSRIDDNYHSSISASGNNKANVHSGAADPFESSNHSEDQVNTPIQTEFNKLPIDLAVKHILSFLIISK